METAWKPHMCGWPHGKFEVNVEIPKARWSLKSQGLTNMLEPENCDRIHQSTYIKKGVFPLIYIVDICLYPLIIRQILLFQSPFWVANPPFWTVKSPFRTLVFWVAMAKSPFWAWRKLPLFCRWYQRTSFSRIKPPSLVWPNGLLRRWLKSSWSCALQRWVRLYPSRFCRCLKTGTSGRMVASEDLVSNESSLFTWSLTI